MAQKIYYISRPTVTDHLWHVHREGQHAMSFTDEATALQWATSHARAHLSSSGTPCRIVLQAEDGSWVTVVDLSGRDSTPA